MSAVASQSPRQDLFEVKVVIGENENVEIALQHLRNAKRTGSALRGTTSKEELMGLRRAGFRAKIVGRLNGHTAKEDEEAAKEQP